MNEMSNTARKEERQRQNEERKNAMDLKAGRDSWSEINPCLKENDLTQKCLEKNNYDKTECALYFENYKNCKDFWFKVRLDRRRRDIYPPLPPLEEREQIKLDYKHFRK